MFHYEGKKTKEISYPLGGIGTGSVGLAGNGQFIDWEIFNTPDKGSLNKYSNFAVRATRPDGTVVAKVLCGDALKDLTGPIRKAPFAGFGFGYPGESMQGFPHFSKWDFDAAFPFATLHFEADDFPARVTLQAFNPFIPLEEDLSGIPAAFFTVSFENKTDTPYRFSAALSVNRPFAGRNTAVLEDGFSGVWMQSDLPADSLGYRDMTVAALDGEVQVQPDWYRGDWQDAIVTFWNEFTDRRAFLSRRFADATPSSHATVCAEADVLGKEQCSFRFLLSWNAPNRINDWNKTNGVPDCTDTWKNYYAVLWETSLASCRFAAENWENLESRSRRFADIMAANTLPAEVNEVAIRNLCVLKSQTVLRLEDGSIWGWEGLQEQEGSCFGSCTHVWNYAYALCFLFPKLERSLRENAFFYNLHENGKMGFRVRLPLGSGKEALPCVDGQMGEVVKVYREWKLSGDDLWLQKMWPHAKKALEYAWVDDGEFSWDADKDGILEGRQHNTLDMELFGPSGWLQGFYMLALKAAAEMADHLGDSASAAVYREICRKASDYTERELFNGSYYAQKVDLTDKGLAERFHVTERYWNGETGELKYQIGEGCEIDQLVAQWHSHLCGLGDIFEQHHRRAALASLFSYNYKPTMRDHANPWRLFAINDEPGTVMCDYPAGAIKPKVPIGYCEECMAGFEYALGGLMLAEGIPEKGLTIIRAVHDRYDGENRNPFNEIECGSNYARSMASFALLPILSGFCFDLPHHELGFFPLADAPYFSCLWSCGDGWGRVEVTNGDLTLTLVSGKLTLQAFQIERPQTVKKVLLDGQPIKFRAGDQKIVFEGNTVITHSLKIIR